MSSKLAPSEAKTFSDRLRKALVASGVPLSPTVIAHEFNLRYWGRGVSLYAVRNWLLGHSLPTQDKLRALSDWLGVSPQELRFGADTSSPLLARESDRADLPRLTAVDRTMLSRYLALSAPQRRLVCDLVASLPPSKE